MTVLSKSLDLKYLLRKTITDDMKLNFVKKGTELVDGGSMRQMLPVITGADVKEFPMTTKACTKFLLVN